MRVSLCFFMRSLCACMCDGGKRLCVFASVLCAVFKLESALLGANHESTSLLPEDLQVCVCPPACVTAPASTLLLLRSCFSAPLSVCLSVSICLPSHGDTTPAT